MDVSVFDILILSLRVAFIFLLYFFVFLVVRVILKEINLASRRARQLTREGIPFQPSGPVYPARPSAPGRLVVVDVGSATTVKLGTLFDLKPVMPIGRRADNAIILNDEFVSSEHALVAYRDGSWWVSDVASTNGTYLNGERLSQPAPLQVGDVIGVGQARLRVEV